MVIIQRPNKDALVKGCDIYLDAMRPFLLRVLQRVKGSKIENTIRCSLLDRQRDSFDKNLSENGDVAGAIDIGMFPHLIRANWHSVFVDEFSRDNSVRDQAWLIREARNKVAHPGTTDLDDDYARSSLSDIADVLGHINAPEEKKAVESIRDNRWSILSPPQPEGHPRPSATGALQKYVIYVDDPTNRSRVHKVDCRYYINRKEETLSDNYWLHGPYTMEKAADTERDIGKKDSGFCGICSR